MTFLKRETRFKYAHLKVGFLLHKLICGENSAGACADYDDIIVHKIHSSMYAKI